MSKIKLSRLEGSVKESISNKEVLAVENQTNANKVIALLAKELGIDHIFVLNDYNRHSLSTVGGNKLLAALEVAIVIADE